MTFLLELKDDLVMISTWEKVNNQWYCWGSFHIDALFADLRRPWYKELRKEGKVIVETAFSVSTAFSLPPDNL